MPALDVAARPASGHRPPPGARAADRSVAPAVMLGLSSVLALVMLGGRMARVPGQRPAWDWFGLLGTAQPGPPPAWQGAAVLVSLVTLLLSWRVIVRAASRLSLRTTAGVALLWSGPLVLGPPLLSLDAFSYVAQGRLAALGVDPYRLGPAALGPSVWSGQVDPLWLHTASPYGPLTTLAERLVVGAGSPVLALVLLHLLAWLSLVAMAAAVALARPPAQRATAVAAVALNPLLLLQLLGAGHWEAMMMALAAAALVAWQRGRHTAALLLASAAAAVKAPAAYVVLVLLTLLLLEARQLPRRQGLRTVWQAGTAVCLPWLLLAALVPDCWGFLRAVAVPLASRTVWAPSVLLAEALAGAGHLLDVQVPFSALLQCCQVTAAATAAATCCWLLATARRRPAARTVGVGLLTVAALGPVLFPWYLAWGLVPLALTGPPSGRLSTWTSAVACFTALPGLDSLLHALTRAPAVVSGIALLLLGALVRQLLPGVRAHTTAALPGRVARPGLSARTQAIRQT